MSKPQRKRATTDTAIRSAKPESRQYKMSAGGGMYLLVTPSGGKLWRLKYRFAGKEKTLSFGPYPEITLSQANMLMLEAKELLAQGIDPQEDKKNKIEADYKANNKALFKNTAESWYQDNAIKAARPWAKGTAKKVRMYLDNEILPALGGMPIDEIKRSDVADINDTIERRGHFEAAAKVRRHITAILETAVNAGLIEYNVAQGMKATSLARDRKTQSFPNVGFAELPQLLKDVEATNSHKLIKIAINLLALLAVRPSELRFSVWSEFDLKSKLWTIPAERMKMRRDHVVPLSDQAINLLQQVQEINPSGHLFVLQGSKPFSENTLNKTLALAGYKGRQTGHGFRHLLSTELNERGYNPDWVEAQLAHKDSNKIRGTYNQAEYIEQRTKMMQEWANSIDAALAGANVTAIRKKA